MLLNKAKLLSFFSGNVYSISPKDAYNLCIEGMILVDIRDKSLVEFKKFDVPQIFYLPIESIDLNYNSLNNKDIYIIADSSGLYSKDITLFLNKKGFDNVFNLSGGILDWERSGLPVITNNKVMLSGSCTCQLKFRNYNDKS